MAQHLHLALSLGGYLGGLLVLLGYGLTSTGRLAPSSPAAQAVNTTGALLLVANGVVLAAWASVGVNVAWIAIGAAAAWRARGARRALAATGGATAPAPVVLPTQRCCGAADDAAAWPQDERTQDAWPQDDWDAAAERLTAECGALVGEDAAAATWPPTAPLPVLGADGRPLA
ncbi:hypothetical protein WDV85_12835 [Pseudokineococcus sp. 5B2Z-1]|uniref:CBU_0592 family membrane protein n=1 Tax=Pseudokineococcus sp. 5B2Z-1 TaxID=3132744 RepID=UPI0030B2E0F9